MLYRCRKNISLETRTQTVTIGRRCSQMLQRKDEPINYSRILRYYLHSPTVEMDSFKWIFFPSPLIHVRTLLDITNNMVSVISLKKQYLY